MTLTIEGVGVLGLPDRLVVGSDPALVGSDPHFEAEGAGTSKSRFFVIRVPSSPNVSM
jgi:hypothetical protein